MDAMQISQALSEGLQTLNQTSPTPRLDAELLLSHVLGVTKSWLIAHGDDSLTKQQYEAFAVLCAQRALHQPVAYLTGRKEFYGRSFGVTPKVLIPRPETEALIDTLKRQALAGRILDVGTGSGALGITLKLEDPGCSMTVSDVSEHALAVARANASALGAKPIRYVQSDLLEHWLSHGKPKPFDVIVSNLPYVDRGWDDTSPELTHEPALALYAEDGGLALIKRLIDQAPKLLVRGGHLLLEADPTQHDAIVTYATNFSEVERQDYALLLQKI